MLRSDMAWHAKLIEQIVQRQSEANIPFDHLCALLRALGFEERRKYELATIYFVAHASASESTFSRLTGRRRSTKCGRFEPS